MKVNSEHLYNYINDLATDEKVKFKVYYYDNYVTQIYWNGESFEWDTGTFTSEAFFNPLYDFEVIKEDKSFKLLLLILKVFKEEILGKLFIDDIMLLSNMRCFK